ncbi:MAG: hypothetical protein GF401_01315 [Chitinivibrionales bacterium]|nr:hypothetical protein [Chitinivibrionales bacterium]
MTRFNHIGNLICAKNKYQLAVLIVCASVLYFPFINQALHIDSDMMVHMARQMLKNPVNPPLGVYGQHMALHDKTNMPGSSVFYRSAHPPLLPLILAPSVALAGEKEWPLHLSWFFFYVAAILGVWYLLGLFFDKTHQFLGTLLWTICPALVLNSHTLMWDVPITAFMIWTLVLFIVAERKNRPGLMIASGCILGLSALAKVNVIALYALFAAYCIRYKRWASLWMWGIPAVALPLTWVIHNWIVFGKIQYFSIGLYSPVPGDYRYRFERTISYLGGAVVLPLFGYWVIPRKKKEIKILGPIVLFSLTWSILLRTVLQKPLWFSAGYFFFSLAGLWTLWKMITFPLPKKEAGVLRSEHLLIRGYSLLYFIVLILLPTASIRYMLPFLPMAIMVLMTHMQGRSDREWRNFWIFCMSSTLVLSIGLSIGDYLFCEADRRLPGALQARGYVPGETWYYGRLSYDYYLYQSGYKKLRINPESPEPGEFLVNEYIPADSPARKMVDAKFKTVPLDTISFFNYPFRTKGLYGGFYGNDRMPYTLNFNHPQRAYIVYRLESNRRHREDIQ